LNCTTARLNRTTADTLRLLQRNAEDAGRSSSDDDDSIWAYYPQLKKSFESNQDFLNKTAFLAQLNATDNAACGWQKVRRLIS